MTAIYPPALDEQEPGVYVRSNKPDADLDFLWDRERRRPHEHERFHLGFFLGGALLGSLVTLGACLLFLPGAHLNIGPAERGQVLDPASKSAPVAAVSAAKPAVKPDKKADSGFKLPFFGAPQTKPQPAAKAAPEAEPKTHSVASGDTLGGIALKYYGDSGPEGVARILKANGLKDTDTLHLDQKLIIPPQSE